MFHPNWNIILYPTVDGIPLTVLVYAAIITTATFLFIKYRSLLVYQRMTVIFLILLTMIQIFDQNRYFLEHWSIFHNRPIEQKRRIYFGETYSFIEHALEHVRSKRLTGKLITDTDPYKTLEPLLLKYRFLPEINLLTDAKDPDCLVFYRSRQNNPPDPAIYRIIQIDRNGFLALKKTVQ